MTECQYVTFTIDERLYGIDIRVLKEINTAVPEASVPRAQPCIRGLVSIRGLVVMVIDIAVIFGRAPRPIGPSSHTIILKTTAELSRVRGLEPLGEWNVTRPIGFLVDRIGDVITVPSSSIEARPSHIDEGHAAFFDGVAPVGDELMMILNAGALVSASASTS